MFLDVNELAVRKTRIRKSYAPGTLDFHSGEFRQVEPLEVRATAELVEGQIRIYGELAHAASSWSARAAWTPWSRKSAATSTFSTGR